jgi:hypothetical protein
MWKYIPGGLAIPVDRVTDWFKCRIGAYRGKLCGSVQLRVSTKSFVVVPEKSLFGFHPDPVCVSYDIVAQISNFAQPCFGCWDTLLNQSTMTEHI